MLNSRAEKNTIVIIESIDKSPAKISKILERYYKYKELNPIRLPRQIAILICIFDANPNIKFLVSFG